MGRSGRCLGLAFTIIASANLALPASACKNAHEAARLCTIRSPQANIRSKPDGPVVLSASGEVLVAGYAHHGQWVRVKMPCIGSVGYIESKDVECPSVVAR